MLIDVFELLSLGQEMFRNLNYPLFPSAYDKPT
jgi:hypothetical protein